MIVENSNNPYIQDVRDDFNWKEIKRQCLLNVDKSGTGFCFIGTFMSLFPSGKYYSPWAMSNLSYEECEKDELYWEALNEVAESFDCWITTGEGDPCDIFVCYEVESKDDWEDDEI